MEDAINRPTDKAGKVLLEGWKICASYAARYSRPWSYIWSPWSSLSWSRNTCQNRWGLYWNAKGNSVIYVDVKLASWVLCLAWVAPLAGINSCSTWFHPATAGRYVINCFGKIGRFPSYAMCRFVCAAALVSTSHACPAVHRVLLNMRCARRLTLRSLHKWTVSQEWTRLTYSSTEADFLQHRSCSCLMSGPHGYNFATADKLTFLLHTVLFSHGPFTSTCGHTVRSTVRCEWCWISCCYIYSCDLHRPKKLCDCWTWLRHCHSQNDNQRNEGVVNNWLRHTIPDQMNPIDMHARCMYK